MVRNVIICGKIHIFLTSIFAKFRVSNFLTLPVIDEILHMVYILKVNISQTDYSRNSELGKTTYKLNIYHSTQKYIVRLKFNMHVFLKDF